MLVETTERILKKSTTWSKQRKQPKTKNFSAYTSSFVKSTSYSPKKVAEQDLAWQAQLFFDAKSYRSAHYS